MSTFLFRAELWEHAPGEPASWHFVTLPADLSDDIRFEAGPPQGFGSVRVEASIGSTTWSTSLFPDAKAGAYVLPVKKQVRHAAALVAGSVCEVSLVLTGAETP